VHGFLAAFPTDAARALGGALALCATTAGALDALVALRDLAFDRFAPLVGGEGGGPLDAGSRDGFADISAL
jgi:hypothetical protein